MTLANVTLLANINFINIVIGSLVVIGLLALFLLLAYVAHRTIKTIMARPSKLEMRRIARNEADGAFRRKKEEMNQKELSIDSKAAKAQELVRQAQELLSTQDAHVQAAQNI